MAWAIALLLLWCAGLMVLWRLPRCREHVASAPAGRQERASPAVSVIIPARNEEHNLPGLLASLARQSLMPQEVIVVDDHSIDSTAGVAHRAGAKVLPATELPEGWMGKPWACWQGANRAAGDILVFLDADVRLEDDGLARLLAELAHRGGLVSVWPYHRMKRAYERLSAFFLLIIMASMQSFTVLGRRLPPLGAFGPCLAVSRADYFAAGGHAEVRGEILEDVALGRRFLSQGRSVSCLRGRGTVSFRMYAQGLGSMVEGFAKNFGSGLRAASPAVVALTAVWVLGFFAAAGLTAIAVALPGRLFLPLQLALYALYAGQLAWQLARLGNYGLYTALLYPLPLLFFAGVFLVSLLRTFLLRTVRWKGRTISVGGSSWKANGRSSSA
jgi:4,4'-diaponeurosporenoate glycosyltransferase